MLERLKQHLEYARYRRAQIRQSKAKRRKDASFRIEPFVRMIKAKCPDLGAESRVLCIGARNEVEIGIFEGNGFRNVTAIDLWSASPRIRVMDMHALGFPDASFDLIFASHVFEHAYDFSQVARECVRVLKPGRYIFCAFPTNFELSDHDRVDFRTTQGLLQHFGHCDIRVLHERRNLDELSVLLSVGKG